MNELIKREDAIKATWHEPSYIDPYNILTEVRDRIEALPTVDAVPVVRCGDCKKWNRYKDGIKGLCGHSDHVMPTREDFFCADGERRTE